jgi:hypothetical protein
MMVNEITQLLDDKKITQAMIARKLKVGSAVVCRVLNGVQQGSSRRVRVYVALQVGRLPSMLWCGQLKRDVLLIDDLHYCDELRAKNDAA